MNEPFTITVITTDPLFGVALDDLVSIKYLRRSWNDDNDDAFEGKVLANSLLEDDPLVVCLAPDVPESLALDVSRLLDEDHPDVAVVLVRVPTPELWREAARCGVRDIIDPDAADTELVPAVTLAAERGERLRAAQATTAPVPTGKVIVILSPKGGSGKTMVSTNLGVALASTNSGDVVLVDLDCAFGDVASVLGMVPDRTIGQLATLPSFDSTTLKVFLTRHEPSGLLVLAGSGLPEEGEAVTSQLSGQVIDILARDFAYVVIDTAAGLDERALAAIERATDIVFLASMDVASIRNLTKEVNALDRLHMTGASRHFVLNRADTRVGLEVAEVEAALGMKIDAALPSSRMVPLSMNSGEVVVRQEPESDVAKELIRLANKFSPRLE
ncbi:MAG TPA: AAA family ATPase, partial [Ilumatobacteraceae bacterium]|nr:AAA family ATPase [Ilumatobacteraceae bacterium]